MAEIRNTLLATSAPLTLCDGFALFPSGSGPFSPSASSTVIQDAITLLSFNVGDHIQISGNVSFSLFFGVCGPAYDIHFHARGETKDGGEAWLQVSDDREQAGIAFGAYLALSLSFSASVTAVDHTWASFSESDSPTYDLIAGIAREINAALVAVGATGPLLVPDRTPIAGLSSDNATVWAFQAEVTDQMTAGSVSVSPGLTIQPDIVADLPILSDVVGFVDFLGGSFSAGPVLTFAVSVDIQVTSLVVDGTDTYSSTAPTCPPDYVDMLAALVVGHQQALIDADERLQSSWLSFYFPAPSQLPAVQTIAQVTAEAEQMVNDGSQPSACAALVALINEVGANTGLLQQDLPPVTVPAAPPLPVPIGAPPGAFGLAGGPAIAAAVTDATDVTVQLTHSVTFDVSAGFYVDFSLCGYTYDNSWTIDITDDLETAFGVSFDSGPYVDQLTNTNGATSLAALRIERELVDVVFEPLPLA